METLSEKVKRESLERLQDVREFLEEAKGYEELKYYAEKTRALSMTDSVMHGTSIRLLHAVVNLEKRLRALEER